MPISQVVLAEFTRNAVTRIDVNDRFNQATVCFRDGSTLRFEHSTRDNRWARASAGETTADRVCQALAQFRLNARHLQLFFNDGSDADFPITERGQETDGVTVG